VFLPSAVAMESVMLFGRKAEKAAQPAQPPKTIEAKAPPATHEPLRVSDHSARPAIPPIRPTERPTASIRYVDRPDCEETFADSITGMFFDGQTLRIEFGVTRVDDAKPNVALTGRRYPACRLVLSPAAAIDLVNKMQQIATALAQSGLAKPLSKADAGKLNGS
jgi:hypothetical protein